MMPHKPISAASLLRATYEDGGFSGGNTDRPALRRLLDDVRASKVDVIVVYKVDRLTRSLRPTGF
jgi:DNA invertase Pin-like site-specific DNA recombinase